MFIGRRRVAERPLAALNSEMDDSIPPSPAPPVIALVRDLLFASRIRAAAKGLDVVVRIVREPAQLRGVPGRRLLADLNQPGAIEAAAAWKAATGGAVAGFVAHVDADTARRARAAGVDRVIARSRFVERLDELLAGEDRGDAPGNAD